MRRWVCGQRGSIVQVQRHTQSLRAERVGDAAAPDRHQRVVRQRLMRPPMVIERDPLADPGFGLATVAVPLQCAYARLPYRQLQCISRKEQPLPYHRYHRPFHCLDNGGYLHATLLPIDAPVRQEGQDRSGQVDKTLI